MTTNKVDESVIGFAVYEDGSEYCGIAEVTLPDLSFLTQTVSGAGIAGNIEAVLAGMVDTMTLTLNFRNITDHSIKLSAPRRHQLDLRAAHQIEDSSKGTIEPQAVKHIVIVVPKTDKGGKLAPATMGGGSGDYACRYWATYIEGKKYREIDPLNNICYIDGTDYLAGVRTALGK